MTEESIDQQAGETSLEGVKALEDIAARRIKLALTSAVAVCAIFFPLPILGQFTGALDGLAFGGLTWAWVYSFLQFAVAILAAARYAARAADLDTDTAEALRKKG